MIAEENGQIQEFGTLVDFAFVPEDDGDYTVLFTATDRDGAAVEPVAKPGVPVDPLLEYLREFQEDDMLDDIAEQIGRQWLR